MINLPIGTELRLLPGIVGDDTMDNFTPGDIAVIVKSDFGEDDCDYRVVAKGYEDNIPFAGRANRSGYLDKLDKHYEVVAPLDESAIGREMMRQALEYADKAVTSASHALHDAILSRDTILSTMNDVSAAYAKKNRRQEIAARAREDVIDLQEKAQGGSKQQGGNVFWRCSVTKSEFIVDKEKRAVVALVTYLMHDKSVLTKGIAKAHPDDEFDVDVGKAIALRRAYGLDIPQEYEGGR